MTRRKRISGGNILADNTSQYVATDSRTRYPRRRRRIDHLTTDQFRLERLERDPDS
jgi:hypothetical protein